MTHSQKILIIKLLTGHFLRATRSNGKKCYVLYDDKINPLQKIHAKTVDRIDRFLDSDLKLWKKDKYGSITLNLSTVRQLHGRHTIKRLYKQKRELLDNHIIYKSRNNRKKIKTTANEKANTLF